MILHRKTPPKTRKMEAREQKCVVCQGKAEDLCGAWIGDTSNGRECRTPLCRSDARVISGIFLCPTHKGKS